MGKAAEVEPEVMVGEAEVEEEDRYSGATVVLSEGGTEVNEEEEVVHPVESREVVTEQAVEEIGQEVENKGQEIENREEEKEHVVVVTDDEEVVERPMLKEVLATNGWTLLRGAGFDDEEGEEGSRPLLRRPRSRRRTLIDEIAAPEKRQTIGTTPQVGETTAHTEGRRDEVAAEVEETEEERMRRERKMKGRKWQNQ